MKFGWFGLVGVTMFACGPEIDSALVDEGSESAAASTELRKKKDAGTADAGTDAGAQGPVVFTIVFENHDYDEVVGSSDAPFFNELIAKYGLATNYSDCGIHPSLPNYLCLISGAPQYSGGVDLLPTSAPFPVVAQHLGSQLLAAGLKFKSYQESMGTACKLTNSGRYAPKHDPFLYFQDIQRGPNKLCASVNVDHSQLTRDLAADENRYYFITPNLTNDGHDPITDPRAALRQSDAWARAEVAKIIASPAYQRGGVLFITWDEAEGRSGHSADRVPLIVVSERLVATGFKSAKAYSHASTLATVEDLLRLPRLPAVANEPSLAEFFK